MCLCAADRSIRPVLALNAYSSKTVKATDFKFGVYVPRDLQSHKNDFKLLLCKNSLGGDMYSRERLLVIFAPASIKPAVQAEVLSTVSMVGMASSHQQTCS